MILSDRSERRRRLRRSHLGQTALTAYSNYVIRFFWRDKHPVFLQQGSVLRKSGQPESQVYGKTPGDKSLPPSFLACLFPCCTIRYEKGEREGRGGVFREQRLFIFYPRSFLSATKPERNFTAATRGISARKRDKRAFPPPQPRATSYYSGGK